MKCESCGKTFNNTIFLPYKNVVKCFDCQYQHQTLRMRQKSHGSMPRVNVSNLYMSNPIINTQLKEIFNTLQLEIPVNLCWHLISLYCRYCHAFRKIDYIQIQKDRLLCRVCNHRLKLNQKTKYNRIKYIIFKHLMEVSK